MITKHKKKIMLVAIILMLVSGYLPYSFNNRNPVNNTQVTQSQLCCCGNNASCCQDCNCSEGIAESDSIGKYTITITSCGGSADDIITVSTLKYFLLLSVFVNYMPVATLTETDELQIKDVLTKPPYKPSKSQLLTHHT
jgi:hypothetical protein